VTGLDPQIVALSREEIRDAVERMEQVLLAIESGAAPADALDALFRDAHSIKGTAGMVGLDAEAAAARAVEQRLEECRGAGGDLRPLVAPLLTAVDVIRRGPAPDPAPAVPARAIRIGAEKVDRMLDAVGETVLHHRRIEHELVKSGGAVEADEELSTGERLLSELQEAVLEMRTLPLDSITAAYPRAVRDLALTEGKEVELVITGGETQLDRVILEGVSEPIIHLARNAIAHGIERPEERTLLGKPPAGRLELRAEQRGSMVAIELADDGRGVSAALLAQTGNGRSLTDLLAAPGFSTAGEVSELAGRGVGLDAVKAHVERLGGSLEVSSQTGAGTVVTMLLPLTLALLRALLCERGGERFCLPLAAVREVVAVGETTSLGGRRALALRGDAVPVADLADVLGMAAPPLGDLPPALIVGTGEHSVAVSCDVVLGDREIVLKGLGPLLAGVPGYLGATILDDGGIALVLDHNHIVRTAATAVAPARSAPSTTVASKILVVDDQFTVREMQRSILETAGYVVETARDGREALGLVTADAGIDMVLTDVQMPEMDGFALLRAIRALPERASLPVAIVTSVDGEEQRRRGIDEGADAYILKQQFEQQTLLDIVGRLVRP
jgi:two-component system chemotaxis sensor kinase CheA